MARRLTQNDVRKIALSFAETHEDSHFGRPDFRVCNKIFATLPEDGLSVNIKVSIDSIDALVKADPRTFESIWNGRMLGVKLATVDAKTLRSLLLDAWTTRAPKRLSRAGG